MTLGYTYGDAPKTSLYEQVWCPVVFDLSAVPSSTSSVVAQSYPIWINPFGTLPAYNSYGSDRTTGATLASSALIVAEVREVMIWIESDISISSGTFSASWGSVSSILSAIFPLQNHTYTLVDATLRGTIIRVPAASLTAKQIYSASEGVVVNGSKTAGASGTGKFRLGAIISRELI